MAANTIWCYNDTGGERGETYETFEKTEAEIIEDYFPYWKSQMEKKYGKGHNLITRKLCIEDWVVVNWAWKKVK